MGTTVQGIMGGARRRAVAAAAAVIALSACDPAPDTGRPAADSAITVTDPAGRSVTLPRPARRVVGMMPAVNEWIVALGAADRLVARTDYDDHPALDSLPSVGGGLTPSVEWLASREPDLVIAWPDAPSRSLVSRLGALGIPVYTAPVETIAEAFGVVVDLGAMLGLEDRADAGIRGVREELRAVSRSTEGRPRPAVLYLIGLDPLMAAGPGTFVAELLDIAGGENVVADLGARWPQIALEEVIRRDPDVVIIGTAPGNDPLASLRGRPGWRDVTAVREGRVHTVDPNLVNRPGPRLGEAARLLASLIHDGAPPPAPRAP